MAILYPTSAERWNHGRVSNGRPTPMNRGGIYTRSGDFIIRIKTDNAGTSNNDQFTLPVKAGWDYDYQIEWGDGQIDDVSTDSDQTHTYDSAGTYIVRIRGSFPSIHFNNGGDKAKLLDIVQWGDISIRSLSGSYWGCTNLNIPATDLPDLVQVGGTFTWSGGFQSCDLSTCPRIGLWPVDQVTSGTWIFANADLDADLSTWRLGSSDWRHMFRNCDNLDFSMANWTWEGLVQADGMWQDAAGMSTANYDATLIGAAAADVNDNVTIHFGGAKYTAGGDAEDAKDHLTSVHSWTITDGGAA